jgi:hypothetical protein
MTYGKKKMRTVRHNQIEPPFATVAKAAEVVGQKLAKVPKVAKAAKAVPGQMLGYQGPRRKTRSAPKPRAKPRKTRGAPKPRGQNRPAAVAYRKKKAKKKTAKKRTK